MDPKVIEFLTGAGAGLNAKLVEAKKTVGNDVRVGFNAISPAMDLPAEHFPLIAGLAELHGLVFIAVSVNAELVFKKKEEETTA